MSTQTTNYNLIKPELTDAANITDMNTNWDTIDAELKRVSEGADISFDGAISEIVDTDLPANKILITDENGKITASEVSESQLEYIENIESNLDDLLANKVNRVGDTMTGELTFENPDDYTAVGKYRDVNGVRHYVNFGCGVLGGQGVVCLEVREGNTTTSPILGRFEMGDLGVSYVDSEGTRTYLTRSTVASAVVE